MHQFAQWFARGRWRRGGRVDAVAFRVPMQRALRSHLGSVRDSVASLVPKVLRLLWVVLHLFLWIRTFGKSFVDQTFRVFGLAFLEPRRGLNFCARKLRRLARGGSLNSDWYDSGERPPPPQTLAVIVNDAEDACASECLPQIANVLVWAAEAGIRNVSVYDQDGYIRAQSSKLAELVVKATVMAELEQDFMPPASAYEIRRVKPCGELTCVERFQCGGKATTTNRKSVVARGDESPKPETLKEKETLSQTLNPNPGPSTLHTLTTVDLLGRSDGTAGLLERARRWGEDDGNDGGATHNEKERKDANGAQSPGRNSTASTTSTIAGDPAPGGTTPVQIERWLSENKKLLPPVDVLVVFGRHFHVAGYPPWQLHKCEMYHRGSFGLFTRKELRRVLREYGRVSKRNGK